MDDYMNWSTNLPMDIQDYFQSLLHPYSEGIEDADDAQALLALGGRPLLELARVVAADIRDRVYIRSDHPALDDQYATLVEEFDYNIGLVLVRMDDGRRFVAMPREDEFHLFDVGAGLIAYIEIDAQQEMREEWNYLASK